VRGIEQVAALLISDDPRQKADRILGYLVAEAQARGGAVLGIEDGKLVPFVTRGVALDDLTGIRSQWLGVQPTLAEGRACSIKKSLLAPLLEGGELAGALYLLDPKSFEEKDSELLRALLAKALKSPLGVPREVAGYLTTVSAAEMERQHLWLLLQRNEWNIARVARLMGLSRRTVYLRLRRYGIPREKVPKTLKRSPAM
jgi:DNA-binding protein Fis